MKKKHIVLRLPWLVAIVIFSAHAFSQDVAQHVYDTPNLTFEFEMRRLDAVAKELKLDSEKFVYLVAFNAKDKSKRTALKRLSNSKTYLIKKHRIAASRIRTIYAGCQDSLIMQIRVAKGEPEKRGGPAWQTAAEEIRDTCKK
jgi:hypothetical protein